MSVSSSKDEDEMVRSKMVAVATFNLEYGCERYGAKSAADLIYASGATIVLLQETQPQLEGKSVVAEICSYLGWYFIEFTATATAVIASLPVTKIHEAGLAKVGGRDLYVYVIHLTDFPYIPFEAERIRYPADCGHAQNPQCFQSSNAAVMKARSSKARAHELKNLSKPLIALPRGARIILGGDFNEPSHRDWIRSTADLGLTPMVLEFPTTQMLEKLGFIDCFRSIHPDSVLDRGITWPDRKPEYPYREDRIDFLFVKNVKKIIECNVVPTHVSDHSIVRAVLTVL